MSNRKRQAEKQDWTIYRGDNKANECWDVPPPPPWRPLGSNEVQAKAGDGLRGFLREKTRANGTSYQSDPVIRRMVNAALHLRKPLLITGSTGTGKSTLIDSVAFELNLGEPLRWPVTSRSTLRDGLYSYDAIGRFQGRGDAHASDKDLDVGDFIVLQQLGTAMLPALRPRALLIDEIDKADADLPNDLLNVIEDGWYDIPELKRLKTERMFVRAYGVSEQIEVVGGTVESYEFPFIVMTSNDEREFSAPFLRRCLQMKMPDPFDNPERLRDIVRARLGADMVTVADKLIANFITRGKAGEVLATDQLLNAIRLVMGAYAMNSEDRSAMEASLMSQLGRK